MITFCSFKPTTLSPVLPRPAFGAQPTLKEKNEDLFKVVSEWVRIYNTGEQDDLGVIKKLPNGDRQSLGISPSTNYLVLQTFDKAEKVQVSNGTIEAVTLRNRNITYTKQKLKDGAATGDALQEVSLPLDKLDSITKAALRGLFRKIDPKYNLPS